MAPTNASVALSATWDDFVAECQAAFPQAELTKASSVESTKVKLAKLIPSDSEQSKQRSKNVMLVLEGVKVIGWDWTVVKAFHANTDAEIVALLLNLRVW